MFMYTTAQKADWCNRALDKIKAMECTAMTRSQHEVYERYVALFHKLLTRKITLLDNRKVCK